MQLVIRLSAISRSTGPQGGPGPGLDQDRDQDYFLVQQIPSPQP